MTQPTRPIIFLDMDGVCCDFCGPAVAACGFPHHVPTSWDFDRELGISRDALWDAIDGQGEAFWRTLPEYPWFRDLYAALCRQGDVWIATVPGRDAAASAAGKLAWLRIHITPDFARYILTPDKTLLAAPGRILIDDNPKYCEAFRKAGGRAVLFPRPWNGADPRSFAPPWDVVAATEIPPKERNCDNCKHTNDSGFNEPCAECIEAPIGDDGPISWEPQP